MDFRVLGPFEVWDGDGPVQIAGSKRRALLALLVFRANEVVRSERLIDELWGADPPGNAHASLHSHVSRLRKAIGPEVLVRRERGYVLRTDPSTIDLRRFEQAVVESEQLPAAERAARLADALAQWRGPALADIAHEPAVAHYVERLEALRLTVVEHRIDADLEAGRNSDLVGELEELVSEYPLREHLRGQLILALYRAGRQAEALEVYRETRRVLDEELGLEPSPALRELERAILRQDSSLAVPPPARRPAVSREAETAARPGRRRVYAAGATFALLAAGAAAAVVLAQIGRDASPTAASRAPVTRAASVPRAAKTVHAARHRNMPPRVASPPTHAVALMTTTVVTMTVVTTTLPLAPSSETVEASSTEFHSPETTTTQTERTKPTPPTTFTVTDDFVGDVVDPRIWQLFTDGSNGAIVQQDGQLVLTLGADAVPGGGYNVIDAHVGTKCRFAHDFDARVHFTILEWPAGDNVFVGLNAFFSDAAVGRESSSSWGDSYTSWALPASGSLPLPDASGTLRIDRVGTVLTTYVWYEDRWIPLAHRRRSWESSVIGLQAVSSGDPNLFGHQEVKVAFDNFSVRAVRPHCPYSGQPSG